MRNQKWLKREATVDHQGANDWTEMNRVDESSVEQRLWDFNFSREDKWLKKNHRF